MKLVTKLNLYFKPFLAFAITNGLCQVIFIRITSSVNG